MKKVDWNIKYTTVSVYSFLVVAASLLFAVFVFGFGELWEKVTGVLSHLLPFAYGFAFAFLLSPILRFIEKRITTTKFSTKTKRIFALMITYLITFTFIAAFLVVVTPTIAESVTMLVGGVEGYIVELDKMAAQLAAYLPIENFPTQISEYFSVLFSEASNLVLTSLQEVANWTGSFTSGVLNIFLGVIVSMYMLANKELLTAQIKKILYAVFPANFVKHLINVTHDSNTKFSGFVVGKIIDSIVIGILCAIGMSIFQMPFIPLISLIVGVTNIIPYFGPFIGVVPGMILVFISAGFWQAIGFALFILVLQQFDGNILGPAILGPSTGLNSMWVIFAVMLFGGLYGVFGMIIGVPLLSVLFSIFSAIIDTMLKRKGLSTDVNNFASEGNSILKSSKEKV